MSANIALHTTVRTRFMPDVSGDLHLENHYESSYILYPSVYGVT